MLLNLFLVAVKRRYRLEHVVHVQGANGGPDTEAESAQKDVLPSGRDGWVIGHGPENLLHGGCAAFPGGALFDVKGDADAMPVLVRAGEVVPETGDGGLAVEKQAGDGREVEEFHEGAVGVMWLGVDLSPGFGDDGWENQGRKGQGLGNGNGGGKVDASCGSGYPEQNEVVKYEEDVEEGGLRRPVGRFRWECASEEPRETIRMLVTRLHSAKADLRTYPEL